MMQEDNHVLQIEYTENDYTTPQKKTKATKAILLIKIHQDISSKKNGGDTSKERTKRQKNDA